MRAEYRLPHAHFIVAEAYRSNASIAQEALHDDGLNSGVTREARVDRCFSARWFRSPELVLLADPDFHKFPRRLGTYDYLVELRPVSSFINSQHGVGSDFSQREPPHHPSAIFRQLHFGL